jgi:hypothetical protein
MVSKANFLSPHARTLLIATTLVALVLGVIVWLS